MSRDDRFALAVIVVCSALIVVLVAAAAFSLRARTALAPISPTASSTSTTSTTVTTAGFTCFDRDGYPIHTDRAAAQHAHLHCTTKGTP